MATKTLQGVLGAKKPGRFTSIPQPTASDPTIDAIAENLEQLTGMRGHGSKKAVLWQDLEALGIANLNGGNATLGKGFGVGSGDTSGGDSGGGQTPTVEKPTQPQNVKGYGGFGVATLTWDMPTYFGHSYAEIFQSKDNVFAHATRIGTTPADIYATPIDMDGAFYFWVRFVNAVGDTGPIHDTSGVYIQSVPDPDYLLGLIRQELPDLSDYVVTDDLGIYAKRDELVDFVDVDLLDRLQTLLAEASLETNVTIDEQVSELKVDGATLRATIKNEYYTAVSTDQAIAAAVQTVKSEIEDPNGNSLAAQIKSQYVTTTTFNQAEAQLRQELTSAINGVNATLTNDYYTSAETDHAISQSAQTLTSAIDGVSANLSNNYLTTVKTNEAIAQAKNELQSSIDNLDSTLTSTFYTKAQTEGKISTAISQLDTKLQSNIDDLSSSLTTSYYTKTQTEGKISSAVSALETKLSSRIGGVESDLSQNYYTRTQTDGAISTSASQLTTSLTSSINAAKKDVEGQIGQTNSSLNSLTSSLNNNYYTKTQTDGQVSSAVATAQSTLQSSINGVSASVSTLSNTVANNKGEFEALWGVKTSVGNLQASIGLVANKSGAGIEDATFYVNNANFQVTFTDGDTLKNVPVFGTVLYNGKRYLSINTASIKVANIKDLVAGQIVADSIVASSEIQTPLLRSPQINQAGSNFHVTEAGHVEMRSCAIRSATTGSRMVLTQERLEVYDGTKLRVRIGRL
ncbi:hypothetical protein [Vibrio harveyi]|uniref:hypothetical protein n=1 Tax=Vibrio harveyi TaxID=669 RepID=UPI002380AA8E|nr:hypothetical protein [Vibrio harveyi]